MEQDITFTNRSGRKLHGVLTVAADTSPIVIICHGYASNTKSKTRVDLSQQLLQKNISSFGFDFTGCGESEGELYELTLTQGLDDLAAAYDYVKNLKNIDNKNIGLLGSSFSGSVAVLFAAENDIKVLALKSPVSDYNQIKEVPLVARSKQEQFFVDASKYDIYSAAGKVTVPTLIVHGTSDADVPVEQSNKLLAHLKGEKRFEIIKNADHRYSDEGHFTDLIGFLTAWFVRHFQ